MVDSNHTYFVLKKDDNYYPQVFLKECKYIEKKVVRHIHPNLSDFSYSTSDEFDEKYINRLVYFLKKGSLRNTRAWYIFLTLQNNIFGCAGLFYEL